MADRVVFIVVLIGSAFVFGMDIGQQTARDKIALTCEQQPGETLIATHQNRNGTVSCEYGRAYGSATKKRVAVKS